MMGDEAGMMSERRGAGAGAADDDGYQLIKIHVPELNVQKCLQFSRDQLVWDVKQQCLASLPKVGARLFIILIYEYIFLYRKK